MKPPRKPSNPIKRSVIERLMVYFRPDAPPEDVDEDAPTIHERPKNFMPPPRPFTAGGPLPPQQIRIPDAQPLVDPNAPPLYPRRSDGQD